MSQAASTPPLPSAAPRPLRSSWLLRGLFALILVALALTAGLVLLLVTVALLRATDATPNTRFFSHNSPIRVGPLPSEAGEGGEAQANIWGGHGPVNIMLLGVDQVDCKYGADQPVAATRTDTIILVRVDPDTRRVAMLSIPRDLLVYIPIEGVGAAKINTAHVYGENAEYEPGGGPGLLKEVIWENLGLQVHRFVRVDLVGLKHILEVVGGLDMDLPPSPNNPRVALYDDNYPDGRCGVMTVQFKPGPQHLTPDEVMQYARSRYSTSDFDRSRRQQEVLLALRERLLKPDMVLKAPQLMKEVMDTVTSDLSTREILSLAGLAPAIETGNIIRLQIDNSVIYPDRYYGQAVLRLEPAGAQEVMRRFQAFEPPPTPTPTPTWDPNRPTPAPRRLLQPTAEVTPGPADQPGDQAPPPPGDAATPTDGGPTPEPPATPAP